MSLAFLIFLSLKFEIFNMLDTSFFILIHLQLYVHEIILENYSIFECFK